MAMSLSSLTCGLHDLTVGIVGYDRLREFPEELLQHSCDNVDISVN